MQAGLAGVSGTVCGKTGVLAVFHERDILLKMPLFINNEKVQLFNTTVKLFRSYPLLKVSSFFCFVDSDCREPEVEEKNKRDKYTDVTVIYIMVLPLQRIAWYLGLA